MNKRFDVVNSLSDIITYKNNLIYSEYLSELAKSLVCLALPGYADICFREIECFGLGKPVIMPKKKNVFHNELIADYHYISIDADWEIDDSVDIANKTREKYCEICNNHEHLDFIGNNAKAWYRENVQFPNNMKLIFPDYYNKYRFLLNEADH